jgi:hypothetical protein
MMRLKLLLGLCTVLALGAWAASASADPQHSPLCPSPGTALSGSHNNLTITGNNYVDSTATLTVRGSLTLTRGACLDAFSLATVTVRGNVYVEPGATLALGCTPGSLGPPFTQPPCLGQTTNDTVGGNILAYEPRTMYLDGDTIRGNVMSVGGGPGLVPNPFVFLTFPVKDNTIDGNLIFQGWQGGWSGAIRNKVGGNLIFSGNQSVLDPDSNEVVTNTIGGNLICYGNSPAVGVGDSGGSPNEVGGRKLGQCNAPGL